MSLDKIAKLLRQAESTTSEAEATAFMDRAQMLATRYQVSLEAARTHTASTERREEPEVRRITLSKPRTMGAATYVGLFDVVGRPNNVQLTISFDSTTVWAHGFPSDIDLTEALYVSLVMQMRAAADAYLKSGAHREETVYRPSGHTSTGRWRKGGYVPVSGRTARISFQNAFARKVGQRLTEAKAAALAALRTEETVSADTPCGSELVLKGREVQAADFYREQTKHIKGSWKGSRAAHSTSAADAGREAGSRARLGSERAIGTTRTPVTATS